MIEASTSITRRGFLGHVAGAYTAVALGAGAATAAALEALISRHRAAESTWLALDAAFGERQTPEQKERVARAYEAQGHVLDELLAYRPVTLEEVRERTAYLVSGPWCGCTPHEGEIADLLNSLLPETA